MNSNYKNNDKKLSTDLKANSDVKKLKNRRRQNFKDEANNTLLDKEDTQ